MNPISKPISTRALTFVQVDKQENALRDSLRVEFGKFLPETFKENEELAYKVLNSPYLQQKMRGVLDQKYYIKLCKQDIYYCSEAIITLEIMLNRIKHSEYMLTLPELYKAVELRINGYKRVINVNLEITRMKIDEKVTPTETMQKYAEHERWVANLEDPIYALAALLPCYYLWPWFSKVVQESTNLERNPYKSWFEGNYNGDSSFNGARLLGGLIDKQLCRKTFDINEAKRVFKKSMEFESDVFSDAYREQYI